MSEKPKQNIIAIVYDFDGTLSPNNIQEDTIFKDYDIDPSAFWQKAHDLVQNHSYERTLAYMMLLMNDEAFKDRPLSKERMVSMAHQVETLARAPDGSFQPRPWHETLSIGSNSDVSFGEIWTTSAWTIVLACKPVRNGRPGLPALLGKPTRRD